MCRPGNIRSAAKQAINIYHATAQDCGCSQLVDVQPPALLCDITGEAGLAVSA